MIVRFHTKIGKKYDTKVLSPNTFEDFSEHVCSYIDEFEFITINGVTLRSSEIECFHRVDLVADGEVFHDVNGSI